MPSNTFLNDTAGRPIVLFGFSDRSIKLISFHNESGILLIDGTYLTLSEATLMSRTASSYMSIYFWDGFLESLSFDPRINAPDYESSYELRYFH